MSKPQLTKDFWLDALRTEGDAFRSAITVDGALARPVPTCSGWTVAALVRHVGDIYAWVRSFAASGEVTAPARRASTADDLDGPELVSWWTDQYTELLAMLDGLDPDRPSWNWAPQVKKAVFWHRRMAHETAIHRWDAQIASGPTEPIEARLAADGVTEVLDSWLPAGRRRGPEVTGMVALHATDLDQVWYVRLRGSGIALLDTDTLLDGDDRHERATASGPASDLVLALFGRVPLEMLDISGDAALIRGLRTG